MAHTYSYVVQENKTLKERTWYEIYRTIAIILCFLKDIIFSVIYNGKKDYAL